MQDREQYTLEYATWPTVYIGQSYRSICVKPARCPNGSFRTVRRAHGTFSLAPADQAGARDAGGQEPHAGKQGRNPRGVMPGRVCRASTLACPKP